jgi:hypothetical protein
MAAGCDDCLRAQLGFLSEADYPLDPLLETPEPIYCIDGNPATTPHKAFVGPLIATLVVPPPTLAASGGLTGTQVDITFVNETARDVNLVAIVAGSIYMQNHSDAYLWTFSYGYDVAISSPASALAVVTGHQTNSTDLETLTLGFHYSHTVAAGGTLTISPVMTYTVSGGGPGQSVLHGASMSVMLFGGPE